MGITKLDKFSNYFSLQYNCQDSSKFFTYPFEFTSCYDSLGNQTYNGDSGYVTLYGSHGELVYEAVYDDSIRNGLYKGYSPSGKLNTTGYYVDGLKQGVWFSGSLDGEFDWALVCSQPLGEAATALQLSPFVNLQVKEYDKGVLKSSQNIRYKKE